MEEIKKVNTVSLKELCEQTRKKYDILSLISLIGFLLFISHFLVTNESLMVIFLFTGLLLILLGLLFFEIGIIVHIYYRNKLGLFLLHFIGWFIFRFYSVFYYWMSLRKALKNQETKYLVSLNKKYPHRIPKF